MEDNFKDDSNNDAFKDYRYNDENQFNPDPDAAVPTQELTEEQEQDSKVLYIEEWQKLLIERYQTLKDTVFESMPVLWNSIELILSIKPILHIKDITLPLIMILLGAPSSTKTVGLTALLDSPMTFYTDNFTRASFVSHNTGMKEEQLKKIDMLPMIKNKLVLAPEMAPFRKEG